MNTDETNNLCRLMEAMRQTGMAELQVGEIRLRLGARLPSATLAEAL
jgi:hypothetical protein